MSIASTASPIVYNEALRGDSKTNFIDDMLLNLTLAGWGSEAIAGGYKFTLVSPQTIGCKCKIYDRVVPGRPDVVTIQFLDIAETKFGYQHLIQCAPSRVYQVWANKCGLFTSLHGVVYPAAFDNNAVQGGIPFVGSDEAGCDEDVEPGDTTEAWWSCGDQGLSMRATYSKYSAWSACFNGDLMNTETHGAYPNVASLRLVPVTLLINVDYNFGGAPRTRRFNHDPLFIDPLIAWGGSSPTSVARIRGQLYDALMPTADRALDFKESIFDGDWVNYMHDDALPETDITMKSRYSSLYLLRGQPGGVGGHSRYAY